MMILFLADVNFNNDIVRGVRRRNLKVDIVLAQEVGLTRAVDPDLLAWAANANGVVLTHDVSTMTRYAYERVERGVPMPGVFEVSLDVPIGIVIDDILLLAECSLPGEWEGQVRYLPLR